MAKVIIGIHGLENKPPKEILQEWWELSMREGLKKTGKDFSFPKFELVYWADLLYEKPLDLNETNPDAPLYLEEKYYPANENIKKESHPIRKMILDWFDEAAENIFMNNDYTTNYSYISNVVIRKFFKDLEAYYENMQVKRNGTVLKVREEIRNRLAGILNKYKRDDIFLVAHSMGTIIAFDVLSFHHVRNKINTFVTMGSPLGIPFVRSRIAQEGKNVVSSNNKLLTPDNIKRWYNFSDLEDSVAVNYALENDFDANKHKIKPVDYVVTNDYMAGNEKNPHKSFGYLRTPEFSNVLLEFIQRKEKGFIRRFFDLLSSSENDE